MTDKNLKDALARSYAIPDLDESTAARLKRNALAGRPRLRTRRSWRTLVVIGALCAATAYAYPIVRANLFALELARKLNPPEAYTMILDGGSGNGKELQIYRGAIASVESPGVTYLIDEKGVGRSIDTDQGIAINQGSAKDNLLLLPQKIVPYLSALSASRRLTQLEDGKVGGRVISRYRLTSDEKNITIEISLYNDTGELEEFRWTPSDGANSPIPIDLHMRFVYDSTAKAKFDQISKVYQHEVNQVDFLKIAEGLSKHARVTAKLGSETVTVYRFERTSSGAVFLLYTLTGRYDGDQMPYVRLFDHVGHQWLPDCVQLSPEMKLGNHQAVEEIFFPPFGIEDVPTKLSVMASASAKGIDLLPDMRMQPMHVSGYGLRQIADIQPTPVRRIPDWFYFKASYVGWINFRNYGEAMQLHDLVDRGEYRTAIELGEKLLPRVEPQDHIHLGTRRWIILDLAQSYSSLSDHEKAKKYLHKVMDESIAEPGGETGEFMQTLKKVCSREALAIPTALDP